jgi:hypothetical protein
LFLFFFFFVGSHKTGGGGAGAAGAPRQLFRNLSVWDPTREVDGVFETNGQTLHFD